MTVRFYGQGMVRPGAWSVGGQIVRTDVDALHCPVPEMWSDAATDAHEQHTRQLAVFMGRYSTQVVTYPATFTSVNLMSTHGAMLMAYSRSR